MNPILARSDEPDIHDGIEEVSSHREHTKRRWHTAKLAKLGIVTGHVRHGVLNRRPKEPAARDHSQRSTVTLSQTQDFWTALNGNVVLCSLESMSRRLASQAQAVQSLDALKTRYRMREHAERSKILPNGLLDRRESSPRRGCITAIFKPLDNHITTTMLDASLADEIHWRMLALKEERDNLRIELKYARETIKELTSQNSEYLGLLVKTEAQAAAITKVTQPKQNDRLTHEKDIRGTDWIMGTWLSSAEDRALLGHVEIDWTKGDYQRALASLDKILIEDKMTHKTRVNAKLLKSTILRTCEQSEKALAQTEEALGICDRWPMYDLAGKAQFHRGLCYFQMELFAEASWCFSLATHTDGHIEEVAIHKKDAEEKRTRLSKGDPRRMVSTNYKPIPEQ
ncbi:MAG: hypothetical protein M1812_000688 [Candelaria pacifica]|nr:MAG: hypothetical protein M1812_000688 [Candelaria pacifica]